MGSENLAGATREILSALLDQAEQPGRVNKPRVSITAGLFPAYWSQDSGEVRRATNSALTELSDEHIVELRWEPWEEGNRLKAVCLTLAGVASAYALLGRTPRETSRSRLGALLEAQTSRPGWHARAMELLRERFHKGGSVAPLVLDDPGMNADLLHLLGAVADLEVPTLERMLSVRVFGDSKRAEALRGKVVSVLRDASPEWSDPAIENWSVLQAHLVDRVPEYVAVAGPLVLEVNGKEIAMGDFLPSVGLSAAMLRAVRVARCEASYLLTIENPASFTELLSCRPSDVVVVNTFGFASPAVLALLRVVREHKADLPILHWGDFDAGGLRILAHLRRHLSAVGAIGMDIETFEAYRAHGQALSTGDAAGLERLRQESLLEDCQDVITRVLEVGTKLEQEAVPVTRVVTLLDDIGRPKPMKRARNASRAKALGE